MSQDLNNWRVAFVGRGRQGGGGVGTACLTTRVQVDGMVVGC